MYSINKLTVSSAGKAAIYSGSEITAELIGKIKNDLSDKSAFQISLENTVSNMSLQIFYENAVSFFGIIDEYNEEFLYYHNGKPETNDKIAIDGGLYPAHMICTNNRILLAAIDYFAEHSKPSPDISWINE